MKKKNKKRINKVNRIIDLFDKLHPPSTPLNEMDMCEVHYSFLLLEQLGEFTDYYVNEAFQFDEERFKCCVDKDFPGWTKLKETIERFHSKFKATNNNPLTIGMFDLISLMKNKCCLISMFDIRLFRKIKLEFKEII